jgi:glycosyltransferase involved in cell wall biosynthesis
VGRIEARKGIPYLLQAYRLVKVRHPAARLVIVGHGGLKAAYEKLAIEMGLRDVYFEGYVTPEVLPAYYQAAQVFASPSTVNESFGITLLEAMAAGTPAVATSMNGSNTLGVAAALIRMLEDRAMAVRMAEAAQDRARQFDWSAVADKLLDYYTALDA